MLSKQPPSQGKQTRSQLPCRITPQEEKEEIRRMNQFILHSKCMAARDMQVAEKATAHMQAEEEERRVVDEMEARRKAALAELEVGARQRCLGPG